MTLSRSNPIKKQATSLSSYKLSLFLLVTQPRSSNDKQTRKEKEINIDNFKNFHARRRWKARKTKGKKRRNFFSFSEKKLFPQILSILIGKVFFVVLPAALDASGGAVQQALPLQGLQTGRGRPLRLLLPSRLQHGRWQGGRRRGEFRTSWRLSTDTVDL